MIDASIGVYNVVRDAIKPLCKKSGMIDTDTPPKLPYVVVEQIDNSILGRMATSEEPEEAVLSVMQIKVYTNGDTSDLDNRDIQSLANDAMVKMGFRRTYGFTQLKNVLDTSILCFVARYKGVVDTEGNIYNS